MSEPTAEKAKAEESKSSVFIYGATVDRVLVVEDNVIVVNPKKLIQHSDYFRDLFSSKENKNKAIKINEMKTEDLKQFMKAVFEPNSFDFQTEDLKCLVITCVHFGANGYLVTLFKKNPSIWMERLTEDGILELTVQYKIPQLKIAIEEYVISDFERDPEQYKYFIQRYTGFTERVEMNKLKNAVEDYLIGQLKENGNLWDCWTVIKLYYKLEEPELYGINNVDILTEHIKDSMALELHNLTMLIYLYTLPRIKEKLDEFFVAEFKLIDPTKKVNSRIAYEMLEFAQYLPNYKSIIENHLVEAYESKKSLLSMEEYIQECEYFGRFFLKQYNAAIDSYLLAEYTNKTDRKVNLTDDQITELALKFDMDQLNAFKQDEFIDEFRLDKGKLEKFVKMLRNIRFKMPLLMNEIEQYLIEQVDDGKVNADFIEKYVDLLTYGKMNRLKEAIQSYLIAEFEEKHDFKNLEFAFKKDYVIIGFMDSYFDKFEDSAMKFFSSAHVDDPLMQANREHILSLPEKHKSIILKCLFRKKEEVKK